MLEQLKQQLLAALAYLQSRQSMPPEAPNLPPVPPSTPQPQLSMLEHFATCIRDYEGFDVGEIKNI